ncbi:SRR1-like protein [Takifugu flavidus]|nr:SRR1-like protein [Takifugu flavidus]
MSDNEERWQVVRRRKGRKSETSQVSPDSTSPQEPLDVRSMINRIRVLMCEIRCEDFWGKWREQFLNSGPSAVSPPAKDGDAGRHDDGEASQLWECVCYGLGSFSSSVSSRYQLAMLLLLLDTIQIAVRDCSIYDPVFTSGEINVLRELGLTVLTENEEGKRLATRPTVFYLMHCGKALYNNLLWKNWSKQCLPLIKIIGNSFDNIKQRSLARHLKRDYSYISQAVCLCQERQLPCPSDMNGIFNDTAVITFEANVLDSLPQSTWEDPPEPEYQHCPKLEIIRREN